jgi:hypothetical protein
LRLARRRPLDELAGTALRSLPTAGRRETATDAVTSCIVICSTLPAGSAA